MTEKHLNRWSRMLLDHSPSWRILATAKRCAWPPGIEAPWLRGQGPLYLPFRVIFSEKPSNVWWLMQIMPHSTHRTWHRARPGSLVKEGRDPQPLMLYIKGSLILHSKGERSDSRTYTKVRNFFTLKLILKEGFTFLSENWHKSKNTSCRLTDLSVKKSTPTLFSTYAQIYMELSRQVNNPHSMWLHKFKYWSYSRI